MASLFYLFFYVTKPYEEVPCIDAYKVRFPRSFGAYANTEAFRLYVRILTELGSE